MRRGVAGLLARAVAGAAAIILPTPAADAGASVTGTIFVAPAGDDGRTGAGPADAVRTIQHALDLAQPGDTVHLAPGRYAEDVATVRDGSPGAPITITGPADAVVTGAGKARIVQVFHDHHVLSGFTIDGAVGDGSYRDKLVYVLGRDVREGVTGLQLVGMTLQNAGGECVRLRYFSHHNTIAHNTIRNCGQDDFRGGAWAGGGKNGEGVYIGTAVDQWADGKNATADPDASDANWVHDNTFDTQGNECVDIKEGASGNVVERNSCTGQRDPDSAGFDSRGDANVFRYNTSRDNLGAGIRLGGHTVAGRVYGVGNDVIGNDLVGNARGPLRAMVSPQGQVCGNTTDGTDVEPTHPCPSDIEPLASDGDETADSAEPAAQSVLEPQPSSAPTAATDTHPSPAPTAGPASSGPPSSAVPAPSPVMSSPGSSAAAPGDAWHCLSAVAAAGVRTAARWATTSGLPPASAFPG